MRKGMKSLIAACMAAVMLCGCGAQGGNETKANGTNEQNGSQEVESSYPDYLNLDSMRPIVKDGEKITLNVYTQRESVANNNVADTWLAKFLDEKMNIKMNFEEVNATNAQERRNLLLSSNDVPDMMIFSNLTTNDLVTYGVDGEQLLPLSDYVSEELTPNIYKMLEDYPEAKAAATAPDGKIYMLPNITESRPGYGSSLSYQRVFIDTKYMEAAGIEEVPETLDEFIDMLRAFKALDPADFGVKEIWPMVSTWGNDKEILANAFGWLTAAADRNDFVAPVWDAAANDVAVPCADEKYADYIKVLKTCYEEGLIHPDFFTIDKTAARALYAEGSVPVICDAAVYLSLPDRENDFVAAVPLTSEYLETGVTRATEKYKMTGIVVGAETEYPEVVMRLLDWLYSPEGTIYSKHGPVADSEDTLGVIGGFYLKDDGTIGYKDVDDGKYPSYFEYMVNGVEIGQEMAYNDGETRLDMLRMLGVENPEYPELDVSDPDQHYRKICYEAHKDSLVDGLPGMYMDVDTAARFGDLKTVIKNYVDAETAKFVVGQRPIEELPQYFEELKALRIDEYVQICKDYYADYVASRNAN